MTAEIVKLPVSKCRPFDREAFMRDMIGLMLQYYTADELIAMVRALKAKRGRK